MKLLPKTYFIGTHQTSSAKAETLTQQIEQFPTLGENCNIDIDDDFAGINFILYILVCCIYICNLLTSFCFLPITDFPEIYHVPSSKSDDKAKLKNGKYNVESGIFTGNYKNDGVSGEFDGLTYRHSQELSKVYNMYLICNKQISILSVIFHLLCKYEMVIFTHTHIFFLLMQ